MPIVVNLDGMLAERKMRSRDLAPLLGITEQHISLLKSGKVKVCAVTHSSVFARCWSANPGTFWSLYPKQARHLRFRDPNFPRRRGRVAGTLEPVVRPITVQFFWSQHWIP